MLAAGLRELFILGEDYISMVACQDENDVAILSALREAGATGRQSGELAVQLDIDHRDVSRRIYRMNRRMEQEIGESMIERKGHKWKLISRLRRDFDAAKEN
jgi:deoxyadenosine/deoxycytidine kinase